MKHLLKVCLSTVVLCLIGTCFTEESKAATQTIKDLKYPSYIYTESIHDAKSYRPYDSNIITQSYGPDAAIRGFDDTDFEKLAKKEAIEGVGVCHLTLDLKDKKYQYKASKKQYKKMLQKPYKYSVIPKGNSVQGITDKYCQRALKEEHAGLFVINDEVIFGDHIITEGTSSEVPNDLLYKAPFDHKVSANETSPYVKPYVLWHVSFKNPTAKKLRYDSEEPVRKVYAQKQMKMTAPPQKQNIQVNMYHKNDYQMDSVTISGYKKGSTVSIYDRNGSVLANLKPKKTTMKVEVPNLIKTKYNSLFDLYFKNYFGEGKFYVSFTEQGKRESYRIAAFDRADYDPIAVKNSIHQTTTPDGEKLETIDYQNIKPFVYAVSDSEYGDIFQVESDDDGFIEMDIRNILGTKFTQIGTYRFYYKNKLIDEITVDQSDRSMASEDYYSKIFSHDNHPGLMQIIRLAKEIEYDIKTPLDEFTYYSWSYAIENYEETPRRPLFGIRYTKNDQVKFKLK